VNAGPSGSGDPAELDRERLTRQVRLGILVVVCLGLSVILLLLWRGCAPVGTVRGRVIGKATRVLLQDVKRGVLREGEVDGEGSYSVVVPPSTREPMVVIHGEDGCLVESGTIHIEEEETEVRLLSLWSTELRIRHREAKVRFDWSPIPEGEGFPLKRRRYSILIRYRNTAGERAETTLLSQEPPYEIPLRQLKELMREWEPAETRVEVELRAWDPSDETTGPRWIGARRYWRVP
jgi:hypothetical protein